MVTWGKLPTSALVVLALFLAGISVPVFAQSAQTKSDTVLCWNDQLMVDINFSSAGQHQCTISDDGTVSIKVSPESPPPINCSAWYAFRVTPFRPGTATIELNYEACGHRYSPKLSTDFEHWAKLDEASLALSQEGQRASLRLQLGNEAVFVAGQEIIPAGTYDLWLDRLERNPAVSPILVGKSVEGRIIRGIAIGNPDAKRLVVVVGRQHPPEITGAIALFPFVETLIAEHLLTDSYRNEVLTVVVPLLNPDGVESGNWRHNMRDTDLNRDWGPFAQPETQAMRDLIANYAGGKSGRLQLLLDFHSTGRDVFYTLPEDLVTNPAGLTPRWLDRLEQRLPEFQVNRDPGHNPERPVSKAYAYEAYGAPGVTFELGDDTDRTLIRKVGQEAVLAMMQTLLENSGESAE